ncbi:MAG: hypothetical protein H6581_20620 [Bacteroidia bacterium]|nr:hypothetical protein [Bacteroidia bacterium]
MAREQSDKIIYKRFDLNVNSSEATVKETFDLDKTIIRITGIKFTADLESKLYYRGTAKVVLGGEEVFPDNYHCRILMAGLAVAPKDRYTPLDHPPGNFQVKVDYFDKNHSSEAFAPYVVHLYLRMETE